MLAKGYRFDRRTGAIKGTGIIAVSSIPPGGAIYLDNELVSASNNTINDLDPKTYKLRVSKDGFSTWEKDVTVQAEKVSLVTVTLFPTTPDLRPLTFTGVNKPQLSSDGQKIAYAISDPTKAGLWVLDLSDRPFTFSRDPKQIAKDSSIFSYSQSTFSWAPDSKTVLVTGSLKSGREVSYLLESDRLNESPTDMSATLAQTRATWQKDLELKEKDQLSRLPDSVKELVANSSKKLWSPDELKVAVEKDGEIQVYDSKKDQLYKIGKFKEVSWYPDSDHLIVVEDNTINIVESDGFNKTPIYAGSFDTTSVFSWPDGSKLIILASFNQAAGLNLYTINLR